MLGVVLGVWAALGCATAGARHEGSTEAPGKRDEPEKKREARPMSEKVAGRAAEGAIEQALETLDEPTNRERLSRILSSPPMQAAARDMTANVVAGVFDGVDMARAKGQLPKLPSNIGRSIGRSIDRDISPAAGRLVRTTVDSALESALSDDNSARVEALVQRVGASAASGLAVSLRDELGPALAVTLERDIVPAIGRGMQSPEVQAAILKTMMSLGIGAARGTAAGFAEADKNGQAVPSVGGTFAFGVWVAILVAVAFGVLFIVMTVLLVRSNRRQRDLAEQSRKREERFLAVLEGRMDTHHEPITAPGAHP
jgi:heme exporter protein D